MGLMTGDVSINPNAACIVMTTEILRSMIYRYGSVVAGRGWPIGASHAFFSRLLIHNGTFACLCAVGPCLCDTPHHSIHLPHPHPRTARGSELLRETAWIIFDEVHYMQDRERGVIWEETIIFAPKCVEKVLMGERIVGDLVLEERYQGCLKGS